MNADRQQAPKQAPEQTPQRTFQQTISSRISDHMDEARIRLARPDALLSLSLLGLLTGILAGGVIVLFLLTVEGIQDFMLPGVGAENFEGLSAPVRFALPVLAAIVLAVMFRWFSGGIQGLGVAYVLERMERHQGRISTRAFLLQFFGAGLALVGGHSVGREGPNVFLGSASGSLLARRLGLPNNVIRTLVGCGTAAGIAASFNTPLAGVVFALEVVMMEYTVSSFIPVILAAVSATAVSASVFGHESAFNLPAVHIGSLWDLVPVMALGVAAGVVSAAYIQSLQTVTRRSAGLAIEWRLLLSGLLMGCIGFFLPEVMGLGYDSVDSALHGGFTLQLLLLLLVGKLAATSICIGLGVPGGNIGPALFIGAMLGALFAGLADFLPLTPQNQVGLFALLGMGAMMSASLQAPLAALTAMLELTDNPEIILPGMLVVVISGLTTSEVFGKDSVFSTIQRSAGFRAGHDPLVQAQRRIGVASVMERRLVQVEKTLPRNEALKLLKEEPRYLLISASGDSHLLMPAAHLASFLEARDAMPDDELVDLLAIPAKRWQVAAINLQANLQEAAEILARPSVEALVVKRRGVNGNGRVFGILTPEMVESAYRS